MPDDDQPLTPHDEAYQDFVPAVFARSQDEAERYSELLNDHDIPTKVGAANEDEGGSEASAGRMTHGLAVLVPDALLDEASEVIADRENLAEFGLTEEEDEEEEDEEEEAFGYTEETDAAMADVFDDDDEELFDLDEDDEDEDEDDEDDEDEEY
jgi:hypothetical protein